MRWHAVLHLADVLEHGHAILIVEGWISGNHLIDQHPQCPPDEQGPRDQMQTEALQAEMQPGRSMLHTEHVWSLSAPVHSTSVASLGDQLRCKVLWCPTQRVGFLAGGQFLGKAKVCHLHIACCLDEEVLWFQVPALADQQWYLSRLCVIPNTVYASSAL